MAIETKYVKIQNDLIRCDLIRTVRRKEESLIVMCEDGRRDYFYSSEMAAIEEFCYIQRVLG